MSMNADRLIARQEGFRGLLYDDATGWPLASGDTIQGHPTVGHGFVLDRRPMPTWIADIWRRDIVAEVASGLHQRLSWLSSVDPVRRAVLISMAYQLGVSGACGFRRMLVALEARNYTLAAAELVDSQAARQTPGRYSELAQMMATGAWPER
jgi:lysozyme